jgi:insecticidal toxin complex protein TccC
MPGSLHTHTPTLHVSDSRGLVVRQIEFYRSTDEDQPCARVNLRQHDGAGRLVRSWDPRLTALLQQDPSTKPNLIQIQNLSGASLTQESVDAGWCTQLLSESGLELESWDARSSHWRSEYDELMRPLTITEQTAEGAPRRATRFTYAQNDPEHASHNLCGEILRCDDGAGTYKVEERSMTNAVLLETRRLLSSLDLPDWPASVPERDQLLEAELASTRYLRDAIGNQVALIDARGNTQKYSYTLSGQIEQCSLIVAGGAEQLISRTLSFNASGQIENQIAGNGVSSQSTYHGVDGRLKNMTAHRQSGEPLQLLSYEFDPVGNLVMLEDAARPIRHLGNQRIEPVNRYGYDSLYQLTSATGQKVAGPAPGASLPELMPSPLDDNLWRNYTEFYHYDASGNLLKLKHESDQPYTRYLLVDSRSNKAILKPEYSPAEPDIPQAFDACGNLLNLSTGQSLTWSADNQLIEVTSIERAFKYNDVERYSYDSTGQRIRKQSNALTRSGSRLRETRYLPGLELHTFSSTEQLEVVTIVEAGLTVRCLHWVNGCPEGVTNNQVRYSLDDHLGSTTLELDGTAQLISQEGFYPYGGTAWWAARSEVEARYKTLRFSGKERDAAGLYYFGQRYYAPWIQRWINPDPAGESDGLNLFVMVRNNPVSFEDEDGQAWQHAKKIVPSPDTDAKFSAVKLLQHRRSQLLNVDSDLRFDTWKKLEPLRREAYSMLDNNPLEDKEIGHERLMNKPNGIAHFQKLAANAVAYDIVSGKKSPYFTNLNGPLARNNLFPGVGQTWIRGPNRSLSYKIKNPRVYLKAIERRYNDAGARLNPYIKMKIEQHLATQNYTINQFHGIVGLHAEVQAVNSLLNNLNANINATPTVPSRVLSNIVVFTRRLNPFNDTAPFKACSNCSAVLAPFIRIHTDPLPPVSIPLSSRGGMTHQSRKRPWQSR